MQMGQMSQMRTARLVVRLGGDDNYLWQKTGMKKLTRRYEVTDTQWDVVAPLMPGKASDCGVTATDNRLFFNAVIWILRTGAPWADLPERFGKSNTVLQRFLRLGKKGVWEKIFEALKAPDLAWVMLDSTLVRAHQHAAGQKKRSRLSRPPMPVWGAVAGATAPKSTPASTRSVTPCA